MKNQTIRLLITALYFSIYVILFFYVITIAENGDFNIIYENHWLAPIYSIGIIYPFMFLSAFVIRFLHAIIDNKKSKLVYFILSFVYFTLISLVWILIDNYEFKPILLLPVIIPLSFIGMHLHNS